MLTDEERKMITDAIEAVRKSIDARTTDLIVDGISEREDAFYAMQDLCETLLAYDSQIDELICDPVGLAGFADEFENGDGS
jgi:hypothetical protein